MSETHQLQRFGIWLPVEQHEVRPDVAIPVILPVAAQRMIAISRGQRSIGCEQRDDRQQIAVERSFETDRLPRAVVAFEPDGRA